MGWTLSDSVDDFDVAAGPLLGADPAANTVLLTVCRRVRDAGPTAFGDQPARFGWWRSATGSPIAGAFAETPPHPVRLSTMPAEAAADLAGVLALSAHRVSGHPREVDVFVEGWKAATGGSATVHMNQRLYRLGELVPPRVSGAPRKAAVEHRDLLVDWYRAFAAELDVPQGDAGRAVDSRLVSGALWLWEDRGAIVSMAGATPVIAGMARIGLVYTPPDRRRRGYAGAVTAAASADAIDRGAEQVVLFTDVRNPTSNSVYRKLGYRPIGDDVTVDLLPPVSTTDG